MIAVLRIGHRIGRDQRITTHVALVGRAFGADKVFIDSKDEKIEEGVFSVCGRFGGDFEVVSGVRYRDMIKSWDGLVVHLSMYGEELEGSIKKIDKTRDLLVVVGAEKVPSDVYHLADFNVSVGNQPHSEVSALAVFLDRYTKGSWLNKKFDGKIQILPCDRGKKVVSRK